MEVKKTEKPYKELQGCNGLGAPEGNGRSVVLSVFSLHRRLQWSQFTRRQWKVMRTLQDVLKSLSCNGLGAPEGNGSRQNQRE